MDRDAEHSKAEPVGPYTIHAQIAAGGMARVHLGQRMGPLGFSRTVAIKRLHPQLVEDADFVSMLVDEARIAARIAHPNVGTVLDVVMTGSEVLLVLEYIRGESLARLMSLSAERGAKVPVRIAVAIVAGVLRGLHAAHETHGPAGELLGVVHRDVTPQNILVGADGLARVVDFGIARATGRRQSTPIGQVKGKLAYMAPEQLSDAVVDRRADVYAASAVLWEALAGRMCFDGASDGATVTKVLEGAGDPPSRWEAAVPPELDSLVMKGLAFRPENRFASAREMAIELERVVAIAPASEVGEWLELLAAASLARRDELVRAMAPCDAREIVVEDPAPPDPAGTRRLGVRSSLWLPADGPGSSRPSVVSIRPRRGQGSWIRPRWPFFAAGLALALVAGGIWGRPQHQAPVVWASPPDVHPPAAAAPIEPARATEAPAPLTPTPVEASAPSSHVAPKSSASRPAEPPPHRDSCSPPYTFDAMQIKHFKIECL